MYRDRHHVGTHFKNTLRIKPWVITLDGDEASGKSLLALAIDQVMQPSYYPGGIDSDLSADGYLHGALKNAVVFHNFNKLVARDQAGFDLHLGAFANDHPDARVLVASNLARHITHDFNYEALGLQSEKLDININVRITREQAYPEDDGFDRYLTVTAEDADLCVMLRAETEKRKLLQAAVYNPTSFNF